MTRDRHEWIGAYLDGELSEAEQAEFEAAIEQDPALAAEMAQMAETDRLLVDAVRADIPDTVDAATAARFGLSDAPIERLAANDDRPWGRWLGIGGSVAAAAAALVLFIGRPDATSQPWEGDRFDEAMSTTPSMQRASLDDGNALLPMLSFQAKDGRFCREFRLDAHDPKLDRDGIACHDGKGWEAVALVQAKGALADPGQIEVAGGTDDPALDRAYDQLGADAPMSADDERAMIAKRWMR